MRADRYIVLHEWMWTELGLTGNELIVYAMIYGFSQRGEGSYHGSLAGLPKWVGCSADTGRRVLAKLESAGLIVKTRWTDADNQQRCMYQAVYDGGYVQNEGTCKMPQRYVQNKGTDLNIKDINKYYPQNECVRTREELVQEAKQEFRGMVEAAGAALYTRGMLDAFTDYWSEPFRNPTGRKLLRWQGERTWDTAARLRTWAARDAQKTWNAVPASGRPKLRPAIDPTFDYAENQRRLYEIGRIKDGEDGI